MFEHQHIKTFQDFYQRPFKDIEQDASNLKQDSLQKIFEFYDQSLQYQAFLIHSQASLEEIRIIEKTLHLLATP